MPKVSIIVPVYKVEKYINRCVDSIIAQTFTDWELLLVDDGSPDRCGEICDEYAEKDSRIRVFHKQNGGVSSARNVGLENSNGEWIAFIDADDFVDADYLTMENQDCDVIEKSFYFYDSCRIKKGRLITKTKRLSKKAFYSHYVNKKNNALWDKLIRKEIIGQYRFDESLTIGEDFLFFMSIAHSIKSYSLSSIGCYYYVQNPTSAMMEAGKCVSKKISNAESYINNFIALSRRGDKDYYDFVQSVIYVSIIRGWYVYRQVLSNSQILLLRKLCQWKSINMKYIAYCTKAKIYIRIIQLKILLKLIK